MREPRTLRGCLLAAYRDAEREPGKPIYVLCYSDVPEAEIYEVRHAEGVHGEWHYVCATIVAQAPMPND